jgi:hypothetical protein
MNDERIDLSSLDPSRDEARWNRRIELIAARAAAAGRRRLTVAQQLRTWMRPALAIAASVALVSWLGALASRPSEPTAITATEDPASTLARWAMSDERPSTSSILEVLGGTDRAR